MLRGRLRECFQGQSHKKEKSAKKRITARSGSYAYSLLGLDVCAPTWEEGHGFSHGSSNRWRAKIKKEYSMDQDPSASSSEIKDVKLKMIKKKWNIVEKSLQRHFRLIGQKNPVTGRLQVLYVTSRLHTYLQLCTCSQDFRNHLFVRAGA